MRKKHPVIIEIGKRIRELRKAKAFSREAFAYEVATLEKVSARPHLKTNGNVPTSNNEKV